MYLVCFLLFCFVFVFCCFCFVVVVVCFVGLFFVFIFRFTHDSLYLFYLGAITFYFTVAFDSIVFEISLLSHPRN